MGYIQDFERELTELLQRGDEQALIKFVKEKVMESYWNGTKATKRIDESRGTPHKQKSFSRRT